MSWCRQPLPYSMLIQIYVLQYVYSNYKNHLICFAEDMLRNTMVVHKAKFEMSSNDLDTINS